MCFLKLLRSFVLAGPKSGPLGLTTHTDPIRSLTQHTDRSRSLRQHTDQPRYINLRRPPNINQLPRQSWSREKTAVCPLIKRRERSIGRWGPSRVQRRTARGQTSAAAAGGGPSGAAAAASGRRRSGAIQNSLCIHTGLVSNLGTRITQNSALAAIGRKPSNGGSFSDFSQR